MESLFIGFSRPKAKFVPYSWIIRLLQWTKYSHVYIRIPSLSLERDLIYQASGSKVNFIGVKKFKDEEVVVKEYALQVSADTKKKILQYAIDNAGASYGMKSAVGVSWVIVNSYFGRKIPNPFKDGQKTFFCDELAGYIIQETGIEVPFNPENVGPKQIDEFLLGLTSSNSEEVKLEE